MATYTQGKPPAEIRAGSVMSKYVFACSVDDSIGGALSVMAQHRVRRLPATSDGGQLVGMLTLADIARWARATATPGVETALSDTLGDISKRTLESVRTAAE